MGNPRLVVKVDMVVGFRNTWAGDRPFGGFQTPRSPFSVESRNPAATIGEKGCAISRGRAPLLPTPRSKLEASSSRTRASGRIHLSTSKADFLAARPSSPNFGSRSTVTARILRRPPGQLPIPAWNPAPVKPCLGVYMSGLSSKQDSILKQKNT